MDLAQWWTVSFCAGEFLRNGTYWTPAGRRNFIRPVSLSSMSSLSQLEDNIRPRMERSKRFRPSQWNIADEYGWCAVLSRHTDLCSGHPEFVNIGLLTKFNGLKRRFHRANPFDFDIGPDSMAAFNVWLQSKYRTIAGLNTACKIAVLRETDETYEPK